MYYKTVRRLEDGTRVSQWIGSGRYKQGGEMLYCQELTYRPNGITKAPEDSDGIFCYDTLNDAKARVNGNTNILFTGIVEIHIAYPIGKQKKYWGWRFPAIKLGRCVSKVKVVNGGRIRKWNIK